MTLIYLHGLAAIVKAVHDWPSLMAALAVLLLLVLVKQLR
jgi:hypothetical protein